MNFSQFSLALTGSLGALLISISAAAHDHKAGEIRIDRAYARATAPGQPSGAVYLTLENKGKQSEKLLSAASPAAQSTEIHTMSMEGNVMKMREVAEIELKPEVKIIMKPGDGYHIMLIGLKQPLKAGDKLPLTLQFQKAGAVETTFHVEDIKSHGGENSKKPGMHGHH